MEFITIGINHRSASVEIREQFSLRSIERELLLSELRNNPAIVEAIVMSTCNRTEILAGCINQDDTYLWEALSKVKKLSNQSELRKYFYTIYNAEAIHHFFRVACGLDSLILGEKQILGQVKLAVELSRKNRMLARHLNILSNLVIRAAKKAQNETRISDGGHSVSWAAVTLAQKKLGVLKDKTVLILGAGKMGSIAADHLVGKGLGRIFVMNRTYHKASDLAGQLAGEAVSFWQIKEILEQVDVCICSACAPHYLIEKDLLARVMTNRPSRKLLCIDISMPRNIDPRVADLENVELASIDDLDKIVSQNMKKRMAALREVEEIIACKEAAYNRKIGEGIDRKPHVPVETGFKGSPYVAG